MARCSLVPLRLLADDLSKDNFCPLQVQHDHLRVGRRSDLFHYFWRRIVAALPADNITGCSRKSQFTWPHSSSPLFLLAAVVLFVDATGASVLNGASDPLRFSCFGTIQQKNKKEKGTRTDAESVHVFQRTWRAAHIDWPVVGNNGRFQRVYNVIFQFSLFKGRQ